MAKSSRYANCAGDPAVQYAVVRSSAAACSPFFPGNPKPSCAPQIQEFAQKLQRIQFERRHLHFEVVDDTALIDTSLIDTSLLSKGKIGKNRLPKIKNEKKKKKKEQEKKVPRRQARKNWKIKKTAGADEGMVAAAAAAKKYSRAEMVGLSREDLEGQTKKWSEVYAALAASVAAEYDGLVAAAGAPARRGGFVPSFASHRRPSFMENKPENIDAAATAMGKGSPLRISVH